MTYDEYEIYGTSTCKWCDEAKNLLRNRDLKFRFYNIEQPEHLAEFKELFPGKTSVPQILGWKEGIGPDGFWDEESTHIGGYDDLFNSFK